MKIYPYNITGLDDSFLDNTSVSIRLPRRCRQVKYRKVVWKSFNAFSGGLLQDLSTYQKTRHF